MRQAPACPEISTCWFHIKTHVTCCDVLGIQPRNPDSRNVWGTREEVEGELGGLREGTRGHVDSE